MFKFVVPCLQLHCRDKTLTSASDTYIWRSNRQAVSTGRGSCNRCVSASLNGKRREIEIEDQSLLRPNSARASASRENGYRCLSLKVRFAAANSRSLLQNLGAQHY